MSSLLRKLLILSAMLIGLPLLGLAIKGKAIAPYLVFPPLTRAVSAAPLSWPVFAATALLAMALLFGIGWLVLRDRQHAHPPTRGGRWPWWGWLGLAGLIISWLLAWTRFTWFAAWQWATFTPIWLSYIVVINACSLRRSGHCLLQDRPRYLLSLFPLSALFWWYFEYLNRFVQNWHYVGIEDFSSTRYIIHASLAFATVLPAVMSSREWLAGLLQPPDRPLAWRLSPATRRRFGLATLLLASGGLLGLGLWPNYLYPLLWVSPLLLLLAMQALGGEPPLVQQLRARGWQVIYLPALAALQCGFLWEMWNMYSAAKWVYQVPFVQTLHIFEMPLLGYTGYLPFGVECMVIALLIEGDKK